MTSLSVAKPNDAGSPQAAIAITKMAYAHVRSGPSTRYDDLGMLRHQTFVAVYPGSRTLDGWVWIEQNGLTGWVSTAVVTFQEVAAAERVSARQATPFDDQTAVWHERGDSTAFNSIEHMARTIQRAAPNVSQVWVKTNDWSPTTGAQWMGCWDTRRALAIDQPASIDRWIDTLANFNLSFVAWAVLRGIAWDAEIELIAQVCTRSGVSAMVLVISGYTWIGYRSSIAPMMQRLRRLVGKSFHIGLSIEGGFPPTRFFAADWLPYIDSVHPRIDWLPRRSPDSVLLDTFDSWGDFDKPIFPAINGDAPALHLRAAGTMALQRHRARGISWRALTLMSPLGWSVIRQLSMTGVIPTVISPTPDVTAGDDVIIKPNDVGFTQFRLNPHTTMQAHKGAWGWQYFSKAPEHAAATVIVRWSPSLPKSGLYEISVFIPARHATVRQACYRIEGVSDGDVSVTLDQAAAKHQWVMLGVFNLDSAKVNAGAVYLSDLTGETGAEIAFDAVRWRRIIEADTPLYTADGFDQPMGTLEERRAESVWSGRWLDASPFGRLYFVGTSAEAYHTGADLNLPQNADAGETVYAAASGLVTFAARLPVWGNVIVIKHDPLQLNGFVLYGRYAHVDSVRVRVGQRVGRGEPIATIGDAFGRQAFHLHFDLSPTDVLETNPGHWAGRDREAVFKHYLDPREFIEKNRPAS